MEVENFTILMKALSDANRVRALMALRDGELCVCQIIELLQLAPSTVSKHMSVLKHAKLVKSRKCGRWIYYTLSDNGADAVIKDLTQFAISALTGSGTIKNDECKIKSIKNCDLEELCGKIVKRGKK